MSRYDVVTRLSDLCGLAERAANPSDAAGRRLVAGLRELREMFDRLDPEPAPGCGDDADPGAADAFVANVARELRERFGHGHDSPDNDPVVKVWPPVLFEHRSGRIVVGVIPVGIRPEREAP